MKTNIKIIHWAPRIICMIAILLISMFAFDAFEERLPIWQQLTSFFILVNHNIANVFNIEEILFFKTLNDIRYDFLFNPYEN